MAIAPGTRIGPYEVTALIGEGGMGKVWRAHHTGLKRDDALKVLPDAFASDPERLARFRREAQVLASLNHPNIAHVHGLEQSDGVQALVMELVEGPTLADRIAQGRIPLDEALPIAKQIAEALEAAHERGIIHRDLKPANIKLRPDGTVKVLDFGLAKALEPTSVESIDATASPTITSPAMMTGVGVLLGTAAYMSPEQARGKTVDKRSDVWAFGCVLYEMVTGRRAFEGEEVSDVLASVLARDPDWTLLPRGLSPVLGAFLKRCLHKDRRQRIGDAQSVRLALEGAFETDLSPVQSAVGSRSPAWRRSAVLALAALVVGASLIAIGMRFATPGTSPSLVRTEIVTSGDAALSIQGPDRDIAITPDGMRVIYRGDGKLLVRAVNELEPMILTRATQPRGLFVSPDGQWVGFWDVTTLQKVAITGGPPVTIVAGQPSAGRGATWTRDGNIIFATTSTDSGLQQVSAAGGEVTVLTKPDRSQGQFDHFWPEALPGGEAVLFTIAQASGSIESAQIAVLDLRTRISKVLIRGGSHAHYVPTGHLVYGVAGTLRAVRFDLDRFEVIGTAVPVLEGVATTAQGAANVAIAANGSLVYAPGGGGTADRVPIVSVDRQGRASPLPGLVDLYRDVRVSPDGTQLAVATQDDVWIYDFGRAALSRLTTNPATDSRMLWTPDGRRIIFTSLRSGFPEMFWRPADGTGDDELLLTRTKDMLDSRGSSWSRDGRQLLFVDVYSGAGSCSIGQVSIERPSDVQVLLKNQFCNDFPAVSPDGRWIAYHSNVSGRQEIYVEKYPEFGDRQQVSVNGGSRPIWSRNGRELFFSSLAWRQIFAVPIQSASRLIVGRPQVLFEYPILPAPGGARPYDVAPDGRFIIIGRGQENTPNASQNLVLVQNWLEELKRRVPVN
jgi:eukaryotic-like serine/threonine-protein kinase